MKNFVRVEKGLCTSGACNGFVAETMSCLVVLIELLLW